MVDALKDLLEAESEAEKIVQMGERKSTEITQKAMDDAHAIEQQFIKRIPELHQSFADKANEKAQQTIAEIKLRFDERNKELRELADKHAEEAVEQAIRLILAIRDDANDQP